MLLNLIIRKEDYKMEALKNNLSQNANNEMPVVPGKSADRVHKCHDYNKYPEEWIATYNMLLPDRVTCKQCAHCNRCCMLFGSEETDTSCQFYPSKFRENVIV